MNIIPTTFNNSLPPYTAVGGTERKASTGLSAVILDRGGRYPRSGLFEELAKAGFDYIISMEGNVTRYDVEELSGAFPFVRFILLKEPVSPGEEINLAAAELSSPLFFVLWNDVKIMRSGGADRMAERLTSLAGAQSQSGEAKSPYKRLCTVPLIQDGRSETIPTLIAPAVISVKGRDNSTTTIRLVPRREGLRSLYPFDGIGIYDRQRFIRLGGFDPAIKSFHWQLMDFGFRSNLWGEEIAATQLVKIAYEGAVPQEDSSTGKGYKRFFLKNIAPVFRGDYAHIPLRRFPAYFRKTESGFFNAWHEFTAARKWVETNRYRFSSDAKSIVERWETVELLSGDTEISVAPNDSAEKNNAALEDTK